MDDSEAAVLAHMTFPPEHRTKLHSTNPLERLNGEINRLVGAILLERTTSGPSTALVT